MLLLWGIPLFYHMTDLFPLFSPEQLLGEFTLATCLHFSGKSIYKIVGLWYTVNKCRERWMDVEKPYVFISYSVKNQEFSDKIRDILLERNICCKRAPEDVPLGAVFMEEIYDAIEGCACLLLLLTEESQESKWVRKEVSVAIDMEKEIIPVQNKIVPRNKFYKIALADVHIHTMPTLQSDTPAFVKWIDTIAQYVPPTVESTPVVVPEPEPVPPPKVVVKPIVLPILDNDMLRRGGRYEDEYYKAMDIKKIEFLDTTASAPRDSWDFSKVQDGSIRAWVEDACLYIAGEGGVRADSNAAYMFTAFNLPVRSYFTDLQSIQFNNSFDTSTVTDMFWMFRGLSHLTELDLSGFDTSQVTDMREMFLNCRALEKLTISRRFVTSQAYTKNMFNGAKIQDLPPPIA